MGIELSTLDPIAQSSALDHTALPTPLDENLNQFIIIHPLLQYYTKKRQLNILEGLFAFMSSLNNHNSF